MAAMTPQRRKALAEALRDVQALHTEWQQALQQHEVRVAAQFKEVARRLKARALGAQPKGLPSAKQAQKMRAIVAKARLKPGKGRAKDLRRAEATLAAVLAQMPQQD